MAVRSKIVDGNNEASVDSRGNLGVQPSSVPASTTDVIQTVFRQFLTIDGDGTTTDLRVDGSATSQQAFIQAEPGFDIYIKSCAFLIADVTLTLQNFGAIAPLTNGCRFYYEDLTNGEINIGTSLTSNFEFIRLCNGFPAFYGGTEAFVVNDVRPVGGTDPKGIIPVLDFSSIFGLTDGVKLSSNTKDKLTLEINDNITAIDVFNIIAYGTKVKR